MVFLHEYSTLEGVQEDVVNILLNLKEIALRMTVGETATLSITKKGPCQVTAADIDVPHGIEVVNPELVIANVNEHGELNMTLTVEKGVGFHKTDTFTRYFEDDLPKKSVGSLKIDNTYSPVKKVAYSVDNARVENRTDLDKLTIELQTNGTLDPEEADSSFCKIFCNVSWEHLLILTQRLSQRSASYLTHHAR